MIMHYLTLKCSNFLPLFFTVLLFLSSLNLSFSTELCNPNDKKVLLDIQSYFHNASVFNTWDPKIDCCNSWSGIGCDTHGHVVSLILGIADDVVGNMPLSFGELPFLETLVFSDFARLSGTIPPTIAKLTNLQRLDLSVNNLSGKIPNFLAQVKDLNYIDLSSNGLTGQIPPSLSKLTKLNTLALYSNHLSGPIPSSLSNNNNLIELDLFNNHLSGPIPPSLSRLTQLELLDLGSNQLTGSIPESFSTFMKLSISFDLSFNQLSGSIPSSFGNANITSLNLSHNKFNGDVSFLFGKEKTVLSSMYLENNLFKFDFSKVKFPPSLRNLDVSHNMIYGSIPKQIGQLPLQSIDVSFNQLCGQIPVGRRLKQFSPTMFASNKCLCGLPLPACT